MTKKKLKEEDLQFWIKHGEPCSKSDGDGLTWTLSMAGHAAWILRYRHGGKGREYTVGGYPDMKPEAARKLARELRVRIDSGEDVSATKRRQKLELSQAMTFSQLAQDYMEKVAPDFSPNYRRELARFLKKDITPRIGHLRASDVGANEIVRLIDTVARRSKTVARRVFEIVSVICSHGLAKCVLKSHPGFGLKVSSIIGVHVRRERLQLNREELKILLPCLPKVGEENALAIKILLATCVRKSELLGAKKSEVNLDAGEWTIPGDRDGNKAGRLYCIPLPPLVVSWLSACIQF